MTTVLAVLLRVIVLVAVDVLVMWLMNLGADGGGANIGAGLISFLILVVLSLGWSFVDGRRWGKLARVAAVWLGVAIVVAVALVVRIQIGGATGIDGDVLRSDLLNVAPFLFGLVLVPALIGGGAGTALSGSKRPSEPRTD